MQIERYGITLVRLEPGHLEQVRQWRNSPHVREQMEYQEIITWEQHKSWFLSINNADNLYFMIQYFDQWIGVVNVKNIDWEAKKGEAGIFVGKAEYMDHPAPALAVLLLMDFAFEVLWLERLEAKISRQNEKAIAYNRKLGYVPLEGKEGIDFGRYEVDKKKYLEASRRLRRSARMMYGGEGLIHVPAEKLRIDQEITSESDQLYSWLRDHFAGNNWSLVPMF